MHWTEVAAIIIVVAALIPVVILFVYLGVFAWAGLLGWVHSRRIDLGREYRCDQGLFVRQEEGWVGEIELDGRTFSLIVRDERGAPDSEFLRRLPNIVAKLPELERAARERVPELSDEYGLDSILSQENSDDDCEFALGFFPKEENFDVSIYVSFRDDQIIDWFTCD